MLTTDQIKVFIENDRTSARKMAAQLGQDYYEGKHDILDRKIVYVDGNGNLKEDNVNSNIRIAHPFFTEIVDQGVQYVLSGKDGFIKSDIPELQEILDARYNNNDDFIKELYEILTGSSAKGFDYFYCYKDEENKNHWECADSLGVVEVRAKETDDHCEYLIRWFVDRTDAEGHQIKRIEVWDAQQVTFYDQIDDGEIELDKDEENNPRPHTLYTKNGKLFLNKKADGKIPFIKLPNNRKEGSDLLPIKDIIDDYDLMNVDLSNTLQDTNTSLYVIKGFDGDNLDETILNIRAKKHVGVPEGGDLDIKTVDIPVEARKAKMDIDKENIYRFGMALDPDGRKDTSAKTSIEIKSMYARLDLKANKKAIALKSFLRQVLEFDLAEINEQSKTAYAQKDIYFDFDEREVPSNALENAQIALTEAQTRQAEINAILDVQTLIDSETILKLICEQFDIEYEEIKDKLPEEMPVLDPVAAQNALINSPTEPEPEVIADA